MRFFTHTKRISALSWNAPAAKKIVRYEQKKKKKLNLAYPQKRHSIVKAPGYTNHSVADIISRKTVSLVRKQKTKRTDKRKKNSWLLWRDKVIQNSHTKVEKGLDRTDIWGWRPLNLKYLSFQVQFRRFKR